MDIDDAALMYQGWGDELLYGQHIARKVTMIISDVVNKSMGGKGVMKNAAKIWPLPGDNSNKVKASHLDLLKKFKDLDLKNGVTGVKKRRIITTEIKEVPLVKPRQKKLKHGKR